MTAHTDLVEGGVHGCVCVCERESVSFCLFELSTDSTTQPPRGPHQRKLKCIITDSFLAEEKPLHNSQVCPEESVHRCQSPHK